MITEALRHCSGIGPVRLTKLRDQGIRSWFDVLKNLDRVPLCLRENLERECRRCIQALNAEDISYFVNGFTPVDRWRILSHYLDRASFFDIETVGLEYDAPITVIVCWHAGRIHTFLLDENLDDFLELLDQMSLLVSFNGSSFDVPRVLDTFHIPELPCAHLDLRWTCYHRGLVGGLKEISVRLSIERPKDLQNCDGEQAIRLWNSWKSGRNSFAREQLIRYCTSDVLLLGMLAQRLVGNEIESDDQWWSLLPVVSDSNKLIDRAVVDTSSSEYAFGSGSPRRIRARRLRTAG